MHIFSHDLNQFGHSLTHILVKIGPLFLTSLCSKMGSVTFFWLFYSTWGAKFGCGVSILRRVLKKEKKKRIAKFEYFFTIFFLVIYPFPNQKPFFNKYQNIFILWRKVEMLSWFSFRFVQTSRSTTQTLNPIFILVYGVSFFVVLFSITEKIAIKAWKRKIFINTIKKNQLAFCERFRYI